MDNIKNHELVIVGKGCFNPLLVETFNMNGKECYSVVKSLLKVSQNGNLPSKHHFGPDINEDEVEPEPLPSEKFYKGEELDEDTISIFKDTFDDV